VSLTILTDGGGNKYSDRDDAICFQDAFTIAQERNVWTYI
jgi:hypothetical protein